MPIYEYVCRDCHKEFEILVRSGSKPACPGCGRKRLSRKMSVPASHRMAPSGDNCPVKSAGACSARRCCGGACSHG